MKKWFLTVDWCNTGRRGIFCDERGNPFSKKTQHTEGEMAEILDAFSVILNPQSIELSEEELSEYHRFFPLAEYSNKYGFALKG